MDPLVEVLLTVWALSQEKDSAPPLCRAFPKRLQAALRRARKADMLEVDKYGVYLRDEGAEALTAAGFGGVFAR